MHAYRGVIPAVEHRHHKQWGTRGTARARICVGLAARDRHHTHRARSARGRTRSARGRTFNLCRYFQGVTPDLNFKTI